MRNLGNKSAMKVVFFLQMFKISCTFRKSKKKFRKAFCFWDNCVRIGCVKLCLLRREYWSSAVNVLTNTYKALHLIKTDFFRLNYLQSDHWIWQRCCGSDHNSVWTRLPCCQSKGPLKQDFLDIYLTTFFGVRNLWNKSAMKVIFFLQMFKISCTFRKCKKKLRKSFLFLR